MRVSKGVRLVGSLAVLAGVALAGCRKEHPQVLELEVQPAVACSHQPVRVTWKVIGRARLAVVAGTTQPTADQRADQEADIPSRGTALFPVSATTTFAVRAVDAKDPNVQKELQEKVEVPDETQPQHVKTTCDPRTHACTGTFVLHPAISTMRVVKIANPTVTRAGQTTPGTICITHGALAHACVTPDQPLATPVAADGEWTLELGLPDDDPMDPPPALTIQLQLACS